MSRSNTNPWLLARYLNDFLQRSGNSAEAERCDVEGSPLLIAGG